MRLSWITRADAKCRHQTPVLQVRQMRERVSGCGFRHLVCGSLPQPSRRWPLLKPLFQAAAGWTVLLMGSFLYALLHISQSKADRTSLGQTRSRFKWKRSFYPLPLSSQ